MKSAHDFEFTTANTVSDIDLQKCTALQHATHVEISKKILKTIIWRFRVLWSDAFFK